MQHGCVLFADMKLPFWKKRSWQKGSGCRRRNGWLRGSRDGVDYTLADGTEGSLRGFTDLNRLFIHHVSLP